jgi:hypothetical protein
MDKQKMTDLIAEYLGGNKKTFEIVKNRAVTWPDSSKWENVTIRFTKWSSCCGMRLDVAISYRSSQVYAN